MVDPPQHLINIARGEPDFPTPDHVKQAACEAIAENFTRYTQAPGIPELREAIASKLESENGIRTATEQVVVSCGAKFSVENAVRCSVGPGDEAILISPHWEAYPGQIKLAGARPVFVTTAAGSGYQPDPNAVRSAVTSRTRLLILNSPTNPSGAVYSRSLIETLAEIALEHKLTVISDEVYEMVTFDDARHVSIASLSDEVAARCVTVNSMSKTHAMTGWRIGYAALPVDLAKRVIALQSLTTSAPSSISQKAALAALTGDQSHVKCMVNAYAERRTFVLDRLDRMPFLSTYAPLGTFYCFVDISTLVGHSLRGRPIDDARSLSRLIRDEAGVRVIAGNDFGSDRHLRISFSNSLEDLQEGLERIEALFQKID